MNSLAHRFATLTFAALAATALGIVLMAADPSHAVDEGRGDASASGAVRYVQEPQTRSSFRPDFSSGLRRAHQRDNFAMLRAFDEAIRESRRSTALVLVGGKQVALGAIVGSDGWIATKASQLPKSDAIECRLYDGAELSAEVVQRVDEIDLALLRVDRGDLPAVQWETTGIPPRGTWLATTDVDSMPSAVGVVSAGIQRVRPSKAVLGVRIVDSAEGVAVMMVLPGTGADRAGIRVGDTIVAVDDRPIASVAQFKQAIDRAYGGATVRLAYSRGERELSAVAQLMDLSDELQDQTELEVNGPVSARATGFERVFAHDTVLRPNQCGGPLCDLDGKVVGLNIARAGRVTSYALSAEVVQPLLDSLIAQARLVSHPKPPAAEATPIR